MFKHGCVALGTCKLAPVPSSCWWAIRLHRRQLSDVSKFVRPDLSQYKGASNLHFNETVKQMQLAGRTVYHFAFGQSPFPVPDCFTENLHRFVNKAEYLTTAGLLTLRERIAAMHFHVNRTSEVNPSQIVVGPGSKELLYLCMAIFSGDILLPMPSWVSYKAQCQLARKAVVTLPSTFEDKFWFTPETLEKAAQANNRSRKLLILNSPNNPTGLTLKSDVMEQYAQICRKYGIYVISDEIYGQLTFDGSYDSFSNYYPEGTIVTSGFSKVASAGGWRLGYAIFPQELADVQSTVMSAGSNTYSTAPVPMQYAVAKAIEKPNALDSYVTGSRLILKAVADFCFRSLSATGCQAHAPEAAYYFMPDFGFIKEKLAKIGIRNGQEMCDTLLREANVALLPCDPYFVRPEGELSVRFCFMNFDGAIPLRQYLELCEAGSDAVQFDDTFVQQYCPLTYAGIKELCKWIEEKKCL